MRFLLVVAALAASLCAQTRSGPFTPVTANRIIRGAGAPTAGLCAAAADVGKVYVRTNAAAASSSLYVCANTGVATYAWELSGGGGGGAPPAGSAGNPQIKHDASTFGASTITGNTPGATFGDSATINQVGSIASLEGSAGGIASFGQYVIVSGATGGIAHANIIDISNPASPQTISTIVSTVCVSLCSGWSPFVFGKFAYFSSNSGTWETFDISNPAAPVFISAIETPDFNSFCATLYGAVIVQNKVYLATGFGNPNSHLYIYDITNKGLPVLLGSVSLPALGGGGGVSDNLVVRGNYAYVGITQGSNADPVVDIINVGDPANPAIVGHINPAESSTLAGLSLAVNGNYLYVSFEPASATCNTGTGLNCALRVYNIKDPTSPSFVVGALSGSAYQAFDMVLGEDYLYMAFSNIAGTTCPLQCEVMALSVSNPASPTPAGGFDVGAAGATSISLSGKNISALLTTGDFLVLEQPGQTIPALRIGVLKVGQLIVDQDARIGGVLMADTAGMFGPLGFKGQGPGSAAPGGNLVGCQNYSLSNNGTNWTVNGVAGAAIAGAVTQNVTLFALPSRAKVTSVQSHTTTAWSGTGFATFVSTIGDSVGGTTYYASGAYNLATAVSDTNFQAVPGLFKSSTYAGSNVYAAVTASANLNSNTITGAVDYEICWVGLP